MTTQEILLTVQKLPPAQKREILEVLRNEINVPPPDVVSEDEVQRILFERGIIGNLPNAASYTDADDDFEPIEISGKPLSETVIEERR